MAQLCAPTTMNKSIRRQSFEQVSDVVTRQDFDDRRDGPHGLFQEAWLYPLEQLGIGFSCLEKDVVLLGV